MALEDDAEVIQTSGLLAPVLFVPKLCDFLDVLSARLDEYREILSKVSTMRDAV